MELVIQGRGITVPEEFKEHAVEKTRRFETLGDKVQRIEVKVIKDSSHGGDEVRVETTVIGRGPVVRAEAHGQDKFAAFDAAYGKVVEQLRRARDRRKVHRGGSRTPVGVAEATAPLAPLLASSGSPFSSPEELAQAEDQALDTRYPLEDAPPVEIRRKRFPAEHLSVDEAVDRMELVGHDFFLFVDQASGEPSVVYRRKGWEYGVLSLGEGLEEAQVESARAYHAG